jgi:hypothetical protein
MKAGLGIALNDGNSAEITSESKRIRRIGAPVNLVGDEREETHSGSNGEVRVSSRRLLQDSEVIGIFVSLRAFSWPSWFIVNTSGDSLCACRLAANAVK